jgi:hypothetical protein
MLQTNIKNTIDDELRKMGLSFGEEGNEKKEKVNKSKKNSNKRLKKKNNESHDQ